MSSRVFLRSAVTLIITLMLVLPLLASRIHGQLQQKRQLRKQINVIREEAMKIQANLPELQHSARQVMEELGRRITPDRNPEAWCRENIGFAQTSAALDLSFKMIGPNLPIGMELPDAVRQADAYVHPGLIPYLIQMDFSGTPMQIISFLNELKWLHPSLVTIDADIRPGQEKDRFAGRLVIALPILYDTAALQHIQELNKQDKMR